MGEYYEDVEMDMDVDGEFDDGGEEYDDYSSV